MTGIWFNFTCRFIFLSNSLSSLLNTQMNLCISESQLFALMIQKFLRANGAKYWRMNQVKFVEDFVPNDYRKISITIYSFMILKTKTTSNNYNHINLLKPYELYKSYKPYEPFSRGNKRKIWLESPISFNIDFKILGETTSMLVVDK